MTTSKEQEVGIYEGIEKIEQPLIEEPKAHITINHHFNKGAFVEINSNRPGRFKVYFQKPDYSVPATGVHLDTLYEVEINENSWAKCNLQYYIDYHITVTDLEGEFSDGSIKEKIIFFTTLSLKDKNVVIELGSKSLGDTLAWMPYADEFQNKHGCNLSLVTFQNELFEGQYPNITFCKPGTKFENVYAWYQVGWYYDGEIINRFFHPREVKDQPMQKTASDILGLEYKEIRPRLSFDYQYSNFTIKKPYICIATHSTAQAKYWNNEGGWQKIVDVFKEAGFDVMLLAKEGDDYMGNKNPTGVLYPQDYNINTILSYLDYAELFIGLGSGLSWLSWAMNQPTVIISGFSEPYTEPHGEGVIRIDAPEGLCRGCFNRYKLNAGRWDWCPDHQEDDRKFECSKLITPEMVLEKIHHLFINKRINEPENQPKGEELRSVESLSL